MNREIKFRALTSGSGIWVIGDLVHLDNETLMASKEHAAGKFIDGHIEIQAVSIYPGSIGQFTGLKDKKGNDIYEGDIISYDNILEQGNGIIEFTCGFNIIWDLNSVKTNSPAISSPLFYFQCSSEIEVIGNIHEK